jgi:DNA-binding transcriptional LysR family regulator
MMFGLGVLPPLIARFHRQYPEIHIELTLSESKTDLRRNHIDIDFRISPPVEAGLKRRILFWSERYLVASPEYVESRPLLERPDQLSEHDCLAYLLPGDQYVWHFRNRNQGAVEDISFKPRYVTNNGIALLELARLGEGIALLDDYTVHKDIAQGSLVRLMPDYRVTNTTFEEGMCATIPTRR